MNKTAFLQGYMAKMAAGPAEKKMTEAGKKIDTGVSKAKGAVGKAKQYAGKAKQKIRNVSVGDVADTTAKATTAPFNKLLAALQKARAGMNAPQNFGKAQTTPSINFGASPLAARKMQENYYNQIAPPNPHPSVAPEYQEQARRMAPQTSESVNYGKDIAGLPRQEKAREKAPNE